MAHYHQGSPGDALARALGWFSLALGVAELLAARRLTRALGMEEHAGLVRAYGAREVATGLGLLALGDPRPWIWGRIGGDALDLATLARGLDAENPNRTTVTYAMAAVAGVTALDILCDRLLSAERPVEGPPPDYGDRVGMPLPPDQMRGAARADTPAAPREPAMMRPGG